MNHADVRVGLSGWSYQGWRGPFYPSSLRRGTELEYASRQVRTIEINGSFYSLKTASVYASWRDATPPDFVFAVKGSRYITHLKRLKDVDVPLANFLASGVLALEEKLGPLLWQLPPGMAFDAEELGAFLTLLPRSTADAASLARGHDERVKETGPPGPVTDRPLRHALEVRDPSFADRNAAALLSDHGVALVVADTAGRWPMLETDTAAFRYVRLHGHEELYASSYSDSLLKEWAAKVQRWARDGQDVYVYFDNDIYAAAPRNALSLARLLGAAAPQPGSQADQAARPATTEGTSSRSSLAR